MSEIRKKIEFLTSEQEALLPVFRDKWLKIGLSTQSIDVMRFKRAFDEMCDIAKQPHREIWICDSPFQAILIINLLANLWANLGENLRANLRENLWANLLENLRANLWANLRANLRENLRANLRANLGANLWENLGENLGENLRENLGENLWENLRENLRENLWENLGENLRANLWENLGANLRANLWANLRENLRENLWENLGENLRANLWENLRENLRENVWENFLYFDTYWWGQMDAYWVAFYLFTQEMGICYNDQDRKKLKLHAEICQSACWFWPYDQIVFVSDRPSLIKKDEGGRLHSDNSPALLFRDGYALWFVHGVVVTEQIVMLPETITIDQIEKESNLEVRRVIIERFGQTRYLQESGAVAIHQDEFGMLYRKEIKDDEPLVMVKVINSTPESDGTFKDYFLRVPPNIKTAHEAVAWTFVKKTNEYRPFVQS
jgi:hypothetical protein